MIKKNDVIELNIESITNLGFGVARKDGLVIFISDAVTGDVVLSHIIKVSSSYAVGRVEKYIKKSSLRTESRCCVSGCQSCAYKHLLYEEELKLKKADIESAFSKSGLANIKVNEVIPSPLLHGYRNKAQYPVSMDKDGNYIIGFYAPKSHRVKEAKNCPLAPVVFREILETLSCFFKENNISVYDEKSGTGLIRHIYLRRAEVGGEILLTIVINGNELPHSEELVEILNDKFPDIVGILLNINNKDTNVVLGDKFILLSGRDYIYDTLAGVRLKITAPAFYQVNRRAAEILYAKAKELAKPTKEDILLDLYCGTGSIGLCMANEVKELIGIEISDSAVECATHNAKEMGIENAHFFTGDAAVTEKLLDNAKASLGKDILPSIIILDPPRAGCDERLIRFVAKLNPKRVVYISCNPSTLARDAAIFKELGYESSDVTGVDLFPGTGHVESVVCLTRRLDNELPMA